ncbi:glycoside hydrolase family 3 C-terminal domain-containing protein [Streptomyces sp. J2-1]|uniref:beta-glucosidase family protein n=1 Tax=Streptomyces corallincola TaxID=2851888 RepID=UPI001C38394A|nr:glycoside hydrolase family 3 protein [Streptomyces corallincola]MBV2353908.1 glycoside hydrolase family 3 C-terminal domain-containing protein [Streptomyces corallincola]
MSSLSPAAVATDGEPPGAASADETRWAGLIAALDLPAKVRLLTGATLWALPAEPRLGLHPVVTSDGPQGVRGTGGEKSESGLLAPAPSAVGATWDTALAERLGGLFAEEARRKDVDVVLAPLVNLQRTPVAGRHFEYVSEDPLLTGTLGAALARGLQAEGVAACLKHFVANDSETDRTRYRARIDARTLREVYLAPFEQALADAGPWSVMGAYSGVDDGVEDAPLLEHRRLLTGVLKREWGYDGAVISDWAAARTTAPTANAGLDLVMPGPDGPWGDALVRAVRAGEVAEAVVDDKVLRLMRLAHRVGRLTEPWAPDAPPPPLPGHARHPVGEADFALLREVAVRGMVLLRDEPGLLPLDAAGLGGVALIGPNAVQPYLQGGGSAFVPAVRTVSFEAGLRAALPEAVPLAVHRGCSARRYAPFIELGRITVPGSGEHGLHATYLDRTGDVVGTEVRRTGKFSGFGAVPKGAERVVVTARITLAEPGTHELQLGSCGRFDMALDGETVHRGDDDRGVELVLDSSHSHPVPHRHRVRVDGEPVVLDLRIDMRVVDGAGYGRFVTAHLRHQPPGPSVEEEIAEAVALAERSDVAVVVIGTDEETESEGWDRPDLELTEQQHRLVRAVTAANPRTVVVVNAGAPLLLPWADTVPALLWAWLPGQEAGHALADVLLGRAEPTGRLPWTLPARREDVPVPHAVPVDGIVDYTEGRLIGHRAYDRAGTGPAFPFGHGLGWTTWSYEGAVAGEVSVPAELPSPASGGGPTVTVTLANTGARAGREVVQAYLEGPEERVAGAVPGDRPLRVLAGFAVVAAEPDERVTASLTLPLRAFQEWDECSGAWRTRPGRHRLRIGRSSRDLRLALDLEATVTAGDADRLPRLVVRPVVPSPHDRE